MNSYKSILFLFFMVVLIVISCNEKGAVETSLIGKWKLTGQLIDPGDGSGVFQPISSDKTINFFSNGTFTSNGDVCFMYTNADSPTTGTFSLNDSTLTPGNCSPSAFEIRFGLEDSDLIIYYQCIEACSHKFERIRNE